ncbi:MAG: archaetidylserine decarboxylase [Gammaproteobacteria bacterium]|jgi:phosphatidylserine decarboxylase
MTDRKAGLQDALKSWPLALLPHQLLSHAVRRVTRWQMPWWKNLLIRSFIRRFGVDMSEAEQPDPAAYPDFNSFFTRALRAGVRQQPEDAAAIACPVDGRVSQAGGITGDRILQAKGHDYSLTALLGGDPARATAFTGGRFVTLYLAPRDYHRIHMPCKGTLRETTYVPGRLFSVAPHTTRAIPGLFARNERLVALFDTPGGPMAVVLVGAIFVSCIETVWGGVVNPRRGMALHTTRFDGPARAPVTLGRGAELGRFNMGSTVILVYGPGQMAWTDALLAGQAIRTGQTIGHWLPG